MSTDNLIQGGYIYPLLDPASYDDSFGEGFDHVLAAIPQGESYYIADCWIVDSEGNQHPGHNSCPDPIHTSELDHNRARLMDDEFERGSPFTWLGA